MDKRFLGVIGVIVVVFVGFILIRNNSKDVAPVVKAEPTSHVRGAATSNVTFVEYGDFQCPACGAYYSTVEAVYAKYKDTVTFQFSHFPLISIHQNAFAGSRAAEAASKQDKFWEMYAKLYENQSAWSEASNPNSFFESYAQQIGLNLAQYKTDFKSGTVSDAINADMAAGTKLKITSTPTFVLNGKIVENPAPTVEAFSEIIDAALAAKASN